MTNEKSIIFRGMLTLNPEPSFSVGATGSRPLMVIENLTRASCGSPLQDRLFSEQSSTVDCGSDGFSNFSLCFRDSFILGHAVCKENKE
jgi:hypothetical protein